MIVSAGSTRSTTTRRRAHQCGFLKDRGEGRRSACQARATWRVGVTLRGKQPHEAVTIYLKPICCNVCRKRLVVDDVVNLTGFRRWAALCREKHGFQPKRSKTRLAFVRLDDPSLPPEAR